MEKGQKTPRPVMTPHGPVWRTEDCNTDGVRIGSLSRGGKFGWFDAVALAHMSDAGSQLSPPRRTENMPPILTAKL